MKHTWSFSSKKHSKQESPPSRPQEAYRPRVANITLVLSRGNPLWLAQTARKGERDRDRERGVLFTLQQGQNSWMWLESITGTQIRYGKREKWVHNPLYNFLFLVPFLFPVHCEQYSIIYSNPFFPFPVPLPCSLNEPFVLSGGTPWSCSGYPPARQNQHRTRCPPPPSTDRQV